MRRMLPQEDHCTAMKKKFIPIPRKLIGPPATKANGYVYERLSNNCIECEECGGMWHYKAQFIKGKPIQVNIGGQIMTTRKAMYMAAFPKRRILDGRRISSKCRNQNCINPELLVQITASDLLKTHYTKGIRSRVDASKHLVAQQKRNTRLPDEIVLKIMSDPRKGTAGHKDYGVSKDYYNAIQRGAARRVGNPFAGLGAR